MLEAFSLAFVQRGVVAVLLCAPLLGALSQLVVARRMAFFSAAVGQSALTGVALGLLVGEPVGSTWAGVLGFALAVALVLTALKRRGTLGWDTLVGVALAFTLGLGVCLLVAVTRRFNVHQIEAALFGSLLTTTAGDLVTMALVSAAVLAVVASQYDALTLDALDAGLAASHGVRAARAEYLFVVALTCALVVGLKVMGALMVEALVVVPAAAARNLARSATGVLAASVAIAAAAGVGGLALSTRVSVPSGAAVVLCLSGLFLLSLLGRAGKAA